MMEDFFIQMTWLQGIGTLFGIVQVVLARQNNIHTYLFGIASILISLWVLYQSALYADILLHMYYLVMSLYGWFYWKFGKQKAEAPISRSTTNEHFKALGIVLGCFTLMSYWLSFHTDSDVPIWDAVISAFAWAGMWLMAKRKLENWVYLNVSNIISIPLMIYKDLYIYAGMSVFLFVMGTSGYLKWRKLMKEENTTVYATA